MNTIEREQLTGFLGQLTDARAMHQDGEADALIRAACARQPDAAYLLVQRAMLVERALRDAQGEISRLQGQLDQARAPSPGTFLDANAWGNSAASANAAAVGSLLPPQTLAPAAPVAVPSSAWGAGMLGNLATTAAGVVAGGFLFQGIGHLLGGAGALNGLSGQSARHDSPPPDQAPASALDDPASSAGVFDTSSVDDYIADDSDSA